MRHWWVLALTLLACGGHSKTTPIVITPGERAPSSTVGPAPVEDPRALARRLKDEGKLDVAARVLAKLARTPELDAMLADAWRAAPTTSMHPVDVPFAKQVHEAFAAKRFDAIRPALAKAAESREVDPEILVWLARASEGPDRHRAYARARARLDELGFAVELRPWTEPHATNIGLMGTSIVRTTMAGAKEKTQWDGFIEIWDLGATEPWRVVPTKDTAGIGRFGVVPGRGQFATFLDRIEYREPDLGTVISQFAIAKQTWRIAVSKRTGRIAATENENAALYEADGTRLVSIAATKDKIVDPRSGQPVSNHFFEMAITDDGSMFSGAALDGSIYLGRVGAPARTLPRVTPIGMYAAAMAFHDSDRALTVLFIDGTIATFDTLTGGVRKKRPIGCTRDEWTRFNDATPEKYRLPGPPTPKQLDECAPAREESAVGESLIVSPAQDFSVVRRTDTNRALPTLPNAVSVALDGSRIILSDTIENTFEVRDGESGKLLHSTLRRGVTGKVHDLSDDGRYLAVDDAIWDVPNARETMPRHTARDVQFVGDGATLVRWTDTKVEVVETATGAVRRTFETATSISDASVSEDGTRLVVAAGYAYVWNLLTGELVRRFEDPQGDIVGAQLSADGHGIVTGSWAGQLRFHSVDDGALLFETTKPPTPSSPPMAISPDGAVGASVTSNYPTMQVHFYDLRAAGRLIRTIDVERPVEALAFLANGSDVVLSLMSDVPMLLVDFRAGKVKTKLVEQDDFHPAHPRVSRDGRTLRVTTQGLHDNVDLRIIRLDLAAGTLRIAATRGGGWYAESDAGAVTGSPDATLSLRTSAVKGTQLLSFPANLIWDALEAPDLVKRALSGEIVKPLGL